MKKVIITGFIKTSSPLHIAAPSSARFNPEKGKKEYGDTGVPLTSVQTIGIPGVFSTHDEESGEVTVTAGLVPVPVFSGNNDAGRLRRTIADVFLEALQALGEKVDINTYSAIKCGAATGSPDGLPIVYDEYRKASSHPFLGLLGGGPRLIKRKAIIHNAVALCNESKELLSRSRIPYDRIYGAWEQVLAPYMLPLPARKLIGIWSFRRSDDLRDLVGITMAEKSIENFQQVFMERQAAIIDEWKNKKDKDAGKSKTAVFTFQAMEFVVPGVSFPFVAVLNEPTDAQVGLWLRGFERFCQNESIGGWTRNGFGNFTFEEGRIAVMDDDGGIEAERYNPADPETEEGSYRTTAVTAWADSAENITADEIKWLMRLPAEKQDRTKTKKAAK